MKNDIQFARIETTMIMMPIHANNQGAIHGGELMKLMDEVAGIVGLKHSKGSVVTARVDELVFHKPVHIGDIVTCTGQLTYVGTTSMQVMVTIIVNDWRDYSKAETALTSFFTIVHIKDGKPAKVPELIITTEQEATLYKLGEKKHMEIKSKFSRNSSN